MPGLDQSLPGVARLPKCAVQRAFRCSKASHCHHTANANPRQQCQPLGFRQQLRLSEAAFRILAREIQLDQCIDCPSTLDAECTYRIRQPGAVERMQEDEPLQRLHLVPLKVPDQMPANRHFDPAHLLQRFLHFVLADVVQAHLVRGARRVGPVRLRDRYDRHLLPVTAACYRGGYSASHIGHAFSQAGKSHSAGI